MDVMKLLPYEHLFNVQQLRNITTDAWEEYILYCNDNA